MMEGDAHFSPDRKYRYTLWRQWGLGEKMMFICLNPSTADEIVDDPTVWRCVNFARDWGYGGVYIGNIFALRATNPVELYQTDDPIGPQNDLYLQAMAQDVKRIVAAWGNHGQYMDRGKAVLELLDRPLAAFQVNKTKQPQHPLYLPRWAKPSGHIIKGWL